MLYPNTGCQWAIASFSFSVYHFLISIYREEIKSAIDFLIVCLWASCHTKWMSFLSDTNASGKRRACCRGDPLLIYSMAYVVQWDKDCVIYPVQCMTHIQTQLRARCNLFCLDLFKAVIFFMFLYLWSLMHDIHRFIMNSHCELVL